YRARCGGLSGAAIRRGCAKTCLPSCDHGAALCVHDLFPGLPWMLTTGWTYLRFHGPNATDQKYVGRYGGRRLWRTADRLSKWLDDGNDVFAYFNNDYHGDAVRDARWLRQRLTHVPGPVRLREG